MSSTFIISIISLSNKPAAIISLVFELVNLTCNLVLADLSTYVLNAFVGSYAPPVELSP